MSHVCCAEQAPAQRDFERQLAREFCAALVSPGDRVKHDLWGSGTVISARGVGALVEFDYLGHGVFVSASALEALRLDSGRRTSRELTC